MIIIGGKSTIKLQTRKGTDIVNSQIHHVDLNEYEMTMQNLRQKHPGIVIRPHTISGVYNCHGMTFASRRTGIDTISMDIIKEDDFITITDNEVLPGDVVLYIDGMGEIEHTGFVTFVDLENHSKFMMKILSKWGDGSEVIHGLYNCPYDLMNIRFLRCKN